MDGPFFVVERGNDLLVLADKREVEAALEAIDVRNAEYRIFTSDGTELQLAVESEKVVVHEAELGRSPEHLARAVRKHLRALSPKHETMKRGEIESASLGELTQAAFRARIPPGRMW